MAGFSSESPLLSKSQLSSDNVLIQEIQQDGKQALEYLYQEYWPLIACFARLILEEQNEVEDLIRNGITFLFEKNLKKDFCLRESLKTYLYAICRNQWLIILRVEKSFMIEDQKDKPKDIPELTAEKESLPNGKEMCEAIQGLQDHGHTLIIRYYFRIMNLEQLANCFIMPRQTWPGKVSSGVCSG